jgi:hypothetical protein
MRTGIIAASVETKLKAETTETQSASGGLKLKILE